MKKYDAVLRTKLSIAEANDVRSSAERMEHMLPLELNIWPVRLGLRP
jgi:hypothetical protein